MKLSNKIWEIVSEYTGHVFYVPGGGAMHLVDSLADYPKLERVSMLHEQGAAYAACMYARYTGRLGVCLVTSGPGATNAISGCAAAWMDSYPVLFISGQAKTSTLVGDTGIRTRGNQEITIVDIVKPITKAVIQVTPQISLKEYIEVALSGRPGPVWLDVPMDVQAMEVE